MLPPPPRVFSNEVISLSFNLTVNLLTTSNVGKHPFEDGGIF